MESRRIIYYAGVGIITFATVIIACQGNKTKAVVIDPPASIAPMIRITDDPESGGMPCVNPEQFQRFLNEQTASEESESRADRLGNSSLLRFAALEIMYRKLPAVSARSANCRYDRSGWRLL